MAVSLPRQVAVAVRLARRADPRALTTVTVGEIARGVIQAVSLIAVNALLLELLAPGDITGRLRAALPSLALVAVLSVVGSACKSASTAATGVLEPKVQRAATERCLGLVAGVELEAIEGDAFHKLMDSAQWGAESARRMVAQDFYRPRPVPRRGRPARGRAHERSTRPPSSGSSTRSTGSPVRGSPRF
ncbi:hypothetical protein [Streptomyces sp. bgisy082]|uniref:hypothetical protein n=1 Tax=Streptomyces sp. bgisy082 TaxID=3413776 RepID=UPI003D751AC7